MIAGRAAEATTPSCDRLSASLRVAEFTSRLAAATRRANDVRIGSRNAVHHAGSAGEASPFADAAGAWFGTSGPGLPINETLGSKGSGASKSGPTETHPASGSRASSAANIRVFAGVEMPLMHRTDAAFRAG